MIDSKATLSGSVGYCFNENNPVAAGVRSYLKIISKASYVFSRFNTLTFLKQLTEKNDMPYQGQINRYLRDFARTQKDLKIEWQ
ncbi:MAG: hypothetical protein EA349_01135 [Halomonadaceae bacterium]|nr:MAG: hypothetical protein EA349_01135 [Halomonadaceae bacterium]